MKAYIVKKTHPNVQNVSQIVKNIFKLAIPVARYFIKGYPLTVYFKLKPFGGVEILYVILFQHWSNNEVSEINSIITVLIEK